MQKKKKPLPDTSTDDQTLNLKIDHCASDGDNGSSSRKRAVFSALISEASDRKLTFELQRLLVVVIKLGQNKGLLEHDHE